jgi:hypothetical protein
VSDIREVNAALAHHTLECVVFQWDGTDDHAKRIVAALQPELRMRGGELTAARHTRHSEHGAHLAITLERLADGAAWAERLVKGEWLVIWLHAEYVHWVEKMPEGRGTILFRPVRPVVRIETARKPIAQ